VIYERWNKKSSISHFELVRIFTSEEYTISGNVIPKKWNIPSPESWGVSAFTLLTKDRAFEKLGQLKDMTAQTLSEEQTPKTDIILPETKTFTLKDILALNSSLTYSTVYVKVKEMVGKKLVVCGEEKNKRGKPSLLFKRI
jgi:hypothetical protein